MDHCMVLMDDNAVNTLTWRIIKGAMEVHRRLGPGLLESVYRVCLTHELTLLGMTVASEVRLPVFYKGVSLECGYKVDLLVDHAVVVEVKAADALAPVHKAQVLTYLKLTGYRAGLLLKFNVPLMKDGVKRVLQKSPGWTPAATEPPT